VQYLLRGERSAPEGQDLVVLCSKTASSRVILSISDNAAKTVTPTDQLTHGALSAPAALSSAMAMMTPPRMITTGQESLPNHDTGHRREAREVIDPITSMLRCCIFSALGFIHDDGAVLVYA